MIANSNIKTDGKGIRYNHQFLLTTTTTKYFVAPCPRGSSKCTLQASFYQRRVLIFLPRRRRVWNGIRDT